MKKNLTLTELEVYNLAMNIGEKVWNVVIAWDYFAKDTVGKQFIKSAYSIAANISEGFGRFFYKENKQFGYYERGSLYETTTWLTKVNNRKLVSKSDFDFLQKSLRNISVKLNNYLKSIGEEPLEQ